MIGAPEEVRDGGLWNTWQGKHLTWVLKNGLGIPGEGKAFQAEALGGPNLSGMGSSFGGAGSQCPEATVGAGCRGCSEKRKGLAEAKSKGALTSRLFLLFLCLLPHLSPGTIGDIG